MPLGAIITIVAVGVIFLVVVIAIKTRGPDLVVEYAKQKEQAKANGVSTDAIILSTQFSHNAAVLGRAIDHAFYKMALEVTVPGKPAYTIDAGSKQVPSGDMFGVHMRYADFLEKKGESVPVLVHRENPLVVVIDQKRLDELL